MASHWRTQIAQVLSDRPDVIVVPEFCDEYSDLNYQAYQQFCHTRGTQLLEVFCETARRSRTWITYPTLWPMADGTWRNCVHLIDRQGKIAAVYHKNYPTFQELQAGVRAGSEAQVFETELGRIAVALCFDLNFDDLWRSYAEQRPDLILFCSLYHGGMMQACRAYQCRAHFAGAVAGLPSQILNPLGQVLASSSNYYNHVTEPVNLDCCAVHIDYNEPRYLALKAKYGPRVSICDPGLLGAVLLSSEDEEVSIAEMVREFEIEPLDSYFCRATQARQSHMESATARRIVS